MTSTGKKARKRYGNRFAAKQRRDSGSKAKRSRKRFGSLPFSVSAKNAPEGAVRANDEFTYRIAQQRADAGWEPDANVSVPGPTRQEHDARLYAEEQALKAEERAAREKAKAERRAAKKARKEEESRG